MKRRSLLASWRLGILASTAIAGCATKGQVKLLETEVRSMRIETGRRDSLRAAGLAQVIALQQRIMDSLVAGREALRTLDVRFQSDVTDIQRQLLQIQELTGQSQRRLSELKAQVDARAEQSQAAGVFPAPAAMDTSVHAPAVAGPPAISADQMYQGARQQLNRGAVGTARRGFQEFLRTYPTHELAPDALFYVGESFAVESADSAVAYWTRVVKEYPRSGKASTALYKMGRIEEVRNNRAAAKGYYDRLLKEYPRSDEADLAREQLKTLRP
ncbi:MAG TPA: tetratricopeptide repeat protein [Gemmatimonadales bacterium]|nr:tetratricopeptide repeat protein [Gemmatimonadales bacterium]